jgi:hypothetical protein
MRTSELPGARLCAKHQPQRWYYYEIVRSERRAAAGLSDTTALRLNITHHAPRTTS